jgi:ribosomal protein L17
VADESPQNSKKTGEDHPLSTLGEPYRWKPGQSGNPGGRPRRKPLTEALELLLQETDPRTKKQNLVLIIEALVKKAKKGDTTAIRETLDRVEGKTVQPISGPEGGAIPVSVEGVDEALAKLLDELKPKAE